MGLGIQQCLHTDMADPRPGLPEMFQGPASQIITGPSGHDNNDLAAFLQAGQHGVCKPGPVLFLSQLIVGLLGVFDEVIDNEQRRAESGGRAGR